MGRCMTAVVNGDRLIRTEQMRPDQGEHEGPQRQITHTVYEPGSFTPLVQLSTAGEDQSKPQVLALMAGDEDDDSPMAQMLDAPPADMRQALDHSLHLAMQDGIPAPMQALMGEDQSQSKRRLNTLLTRREAVKRPGRGAAGRSRRATGCRRRGRWWRCGC